VTLDPDLQRDDGIGPVAWVELADRRRGTAIDNTRWKMPQQIDDEGAGGALDQAPSCGPIPGKTVTGANSLSRRAGRIF